MHGSQYRYVSSRFFGVRRSLKYVQSGHHASASKLCVPAMGSTSRWPQHSTPSSGGRRQRHERNLITAADTAGVGLGLVVEAVVSAGPPGWAPWAAAGRVGSLIGSINKVTIVIQ